MGSEDTAIRAILEELGVRGDVQVGIGDDAAILGPAPGTLVANDMVVEDVHFRWTTHSAADVGYLALAVNLSDIAAMGGVARAAVVGLAGPPTRLTDGIIRDLYRAMDTLAAEADCAIVGGDISRAAEFIVAVTVIGAMPADVRPVCRSGARVGDQIFVTGHLGRSAAGRAILESRTGSVSGDADAELIAAHRRPTPRLAHGQALARAGVSAMMDISDGLVLDATRLADASHCRIVIELDALPIGAGVAAVADSLGIAPDVFAATGGEDYELLVAAAPSMAAEGELGLWRVGRVIPGAPGVEVRRAGQSVVLTHPGWDHLGA